MKYCDAKTNSKNSCKGKKNKKNKKTVEDKQRNKERKTKPFMVASKVLFDTNF